MPVGSAPSTAAAPGAATTKPGAASQRKPPSRAKMARSNTVALIQKRRVAPTRHNTDSLRMLDMSAVKRSHDNYLRAPWYILRPHSTFMSVWDGITTVALLFTSAITPFEVAFLPKPNSPDDGLFVANRVLDGIFIIDLLFSFCLMYKVGQDETGAGTVWEYRLRYTATNYLRGWFLIDLLSIAPSAFDIAPFLRDRGSESEAEDSTSTLRVGRVVRTTRLIKLVRLLRSSRLIKRWRTRVSATFATLTLYKLSIVLIIMTHWIACILRLQTVLSKDGESATWLGAFGWCTLDSEGKDDCASPDQLYLACMHWAFGLISGYTLEPNVGPLPSVHRGDGAQKFTVGEQAVNLLLMVTGAIGWAYLTAEIIDVIVNQNPDETNFKNRMDDLNRYISFYDKITPEMGQKLREYMYECKDKHMAESRRAIEESLSKGLQENVCGIINRVWLDTVPFFRGMFTRDGIEVVPPADRAFLAKVATAVVSDCYAPQETPPPCRLYMIVKGHARFRGTIRSNPFCWGALDVMLPKAPLVKTALSTTYLHVVWIDGPKLREIAADFPDTQHSMRVWTLYNGIKEFLLQNLRNASDEERQRAKEWVKEQNAAAPPSIMSHGNKQLSWQQAKARSAGLERMHLTKKEKIIGHKVTTIERLHDAISDRFDALERRMAALDGNSLSIVTAGGSS
eukprot:Transcript_7956.p1 GENE.Transcript_7956~~Transcript_7956.p1  ORF type:complete len:680 (-),score=124.39 Transcript_7956:256-2295(-)